MQCTTDNGGKYVSVSGGDIGARQFKNNDAIQRVITRKKVINIADEAFENCTKLHTARLNCVETIGQKTFSNCTRLVQITLPLTIRLCGANCFSRSGVVFLNLHGLDTTVVWESAFTNMPHLANVVLPQKTETIQHSAFAHCVSLVGVEWPESLKVIEYNAFYGCGFQKLTLPDNVAHIKQWAFEKCANLTTIDLPRSILTIYVYAFLDTALSTVLVKNSLTAIDKNAFDSHVIVHQWGNVEIHGGNQIVELDEMWNNMTKIDLYRIAGLLADRDNVTKLIDNSFKVYPNDDNIPPPHNKLYILCD